MEPHLARGTEGPDALFALDARGNVAATNASLRAWLGYAPEEGNSVSLGGLVAPGDQGKAEEIWRELAAGRAIWGARLRLRTRAGDPIEAVFSAVPRVDAEGRVVGAQGALHVAEPAPIGEPSAPPGPGAFLAFSEKTQGILALAERFRDRPSVPVLIEGESGTGKELIARYIHGDGGRPFVAINCGAIPRDLVESELFGYVPGAFTGAGAEGSPGKIQSAKGGTLFLDEIGDLEANSQVKLLRFLEHGTFYPVGATRERRVELRVLCATNRRIDEAIANREFRGDLYYRINVGHIRIPPLRERPDEILPLAGHFLSQAAQRYGNPFETIVPAAQNLLTRAPWKGNVRELRNIIERIVLVERGPALLPGHLAFLEAAPAPRPPGPAEAPLPEDGLDLEAVVLRLIERALHKHGNNQSQAARYLRITRKALRSRVAKLKAPNSQKPSA